MRHGTDGPLPEDYAPPEWWTILRAADRLQVPVVEAKSIQDVPWFWIRRAIAATRAEEDASEAKMRDQMRGLFGS